MGSPAARGAALCRAKSRWAAPCKGCRRLPTRDGGRVLRGRTDGHGVSRPPRAERDRDGCCWKRRLRLPAAHFRCAHLVPRRGGPRGRPAPYFRRARGQNSDLLACRILSPLALLHQAVSRSLAAATPHPDGPYLLVRLARRARSPTGSSLFRSVTPESRPRDAPAPCALTGAPAQPCLRSRAPRVSPSLSPHPRAGFRTPRPCDFASRTPGKPAALDVDGIKNAIAPSEIGASSQAIYSVGRPRSAPTARTPARSSSPSSSRRRSSASPRAAPTRS